jgi:Uma2 family endonuclease
MLNSDGRSADRRAEAGPLPFEFRGHLFSISEGSMFTSPPTGEPRRHRLSVEDYYRMGEVGILRADERIELIDGEIIDMPPIGSLHAGTVTQMAAILQRAAGDLAIVQVQNPVSLGEYSEPQPDLALLRPRPDFYKSAHPRSADVLLLVEVADATLDYDRRVKLPLYARHGIAEVWLIDLTSRQLTRFRDPWDAGYARTDRPALTAPVAIGGLPNASAKLSELFADPQSSMP